MEDCLFLWILQYVWYISSSRRENASARDAEMFPWHADKNSICVLIMLPQGILISIKKEGKKLDSDSDKLFSSGMQIINKKWTEGEKKQSQRSNYTRRRTQAYTVFGNQRRTNTAPLVWISYAWGKRGGETERLWALSMMYLGQYLKKQLYFSVEISFAKIYVVTWPKVHYYPCCLLQTYIVSSGPKMFAYKTKYFSMPILFPVLTDSMKLYKLYRNVQERCINNHTSARTDKTLSIFQRRLASSHTIHYLIH